MPPLRVFASFDCERDEKLLNRLIAESRAAGSKFTVFDRSSREAPTAESAQKLCERLSHVDAVMVLCGAWTHRSANVSAEIKMAQELGKRYYLLKGRRFLDCSRPTGARLTDKMYRWTNGVVNELVIRNI